MWPKSHRPLKKSSATLKKSQNLCEMGKTSKYSLRTLKNPNFDSMDELGKVMF